MKLDELRQFMELMYRSESDLDVTLQAVNDRRPWGLTHYPAYWDKPEGELTIKLRGLLAKVHPMFPEPVEALRAEDV